MNINNKIAKQSHLYHCPIEAALSMLSNKWKGVILYHLMQGTKRFSELQKLIPGVSQRILTAQLRELEQDKIIVRKVYPEVPPKVEYSFSTFGNEIKPLLAALQDFGEKLITNHSI